MRIIVSLPGMVRIALFAFGFGVMIGFCLGPVTIGTRAGNQACAGTAAITCVSPAATPVVAHQRGD